MPLCMTWKRRLQMREIFLQDQRETTQSLPEELGEALRGVSKAAECVVRLLAPLFIK